MVRTVFLGLDGLSRWNLEEIARAGRLRALSRLIPRGTAGSARMVHPYTPPMWTSMTTGVNPGKHGIYFFQRVDEVGTPRGLHNALDVGAPRIHHILSYNKQRSLIANLPLSTWPLIPFQGTLLPDWLSPYWATWPDSLGEGYRRKCREVAGRYRSREFPCKYLYHDIATAEYLLENYDSLDVSGHDHVFIMFRFIDALMHRDPDAITDTSIPCVSDLYAALDELYERLLGEALDEALVVVAGDHGTDRVEHEINVAGILHKAGLVEARFEEIRDYRMIKEKGTNSLSCITPLVSRIMKCRIAGRLVTLVGRCLMRVAPKLREAAIGVERPVPDPERSMVVLNETTAFAMYVNTRRVPRGRVDQVVDEVFSALRRFEEDSGHRFLEALERGRGHLFRGPYEDRAPHIVYAPRRGYGTGTLNLYAPLVDHVGGKYGNHHPENLHIIVPPAGDEEAGLLARHVRDPWDYAVLILLRHGVPLPRGHDSRLPRLLSRPVREREYRGVYNAQRGLLARRAARRAGPRKVPPR